jgi:NADPH-dependent glutamate synthase beta subunit-like oxidoreductase
MGRDFIPGKKVAVIGGGNVAIDSARTAVRLGADEVTILYRRSRSEMPASAWEVREAEKEGITIRFLTAPAKILMKEGKVCGLECVRMKLGDADERGRRAPIQIKGSEYTIDIDTLLVAVGQKPKSDYLGARSGIDVDERGIIKVDAVTHATSRAGVFAGGDAVNGPSTAVEAVTAGREAAISIIRYLEHKDIAADRKRQTTCIMPSENPYMDDEPEPKPRVEMKTLLPRDRTRDFSEVERGFTEAQALEEASRCLNCGYASVESVRRSAVCKAAIDAFAPQDEIITINVGSIIVSPGLKNFDADMLEKLQGKNGGA